MSISVSQSWQKDPIRQGRQLVRKLAWLLPADSLAGKGSKEFGRSIETTLTDVTNRGSGILRLQLRRRDAAVVMSIDHYEEVLRMKSLCEKLIERVTENEVANEANEYEASYRRITSPESLRAADALFAATDEDLRRTYRPGKTETK